MGNFRRAAPDGREPLMADSVFLAHAEADSEYASRLAAFLELGCDVTCFVEDGLIGSSQDVVSKAEEGAWANILGRASGGDSAGFAEPRDPRSRPPGWALGVRHQHGVHRLDALHQEEQKVGEGSGEDRRICARTDGRCKILQPGQPQEPRIEGRVFAESGGVTSHAKLQKSCPLRP